MSDEPRLGIDDFVAGCWRVCDDGWTFRMVSDQWWTIEARCENPGHGRHRASTKGHGDVETTFADLAGKIREFHHG